MANKKVNTNNDINDKINAHFEAVKDFYKSKAKDVHLPRKIRKEIAKLKTLKNQGKNE